MALAVLDLRETPADPWWGVWLGVPAPPLMGRAGCGAGLQGGLGSCPGIQTPPSALCTALSAFPSLGEAPGASSSRGRSPSLADSRAIGGPV